MKTWLNPRWRIRIFLFLANLGWMGAAWLWFERESWLWIIPIALSINFALLTYDQLLRFRALVGHPLLGNDSWNLLKIVHELSAELKVPTPKLFLIPRHSAQIFAYAKSKPQTRLFLTQGMVELLTPRQLRAVLTYQLLAIRSSYSILNYWLGACLDLNFRVGKAIERAVAFVFGWSPPLAVWLVSPWIWLLHSFLLGSADFYALDRETAKLLENPEDLAQALWKMESYAHTRPWTEPWIFAHMCMVSPLIGSRVFAGLRVQPSLQSRIKKLIGRYPL